MIEAPLNAKGPWSVDRADIGIKRFYRAYHCGMEVHFAAALERIEDGVYIFDNGLRIVGAELAYYDEEQTPDMIDNLSTRLLG